MQMETARKWWQQYSYGVDFKTDYTTKDKEGHYIMIKGLIQEDIIFINIYATNRGENKYIKQILKYIKGEVTNNTIIVGDFNTLLQ